MRKHHNFEQTWGFLWVWTLLETFGILSSQPQNCYHYCDIMLRPRCSALYATLKFALWNLLNLLASCHPILDLRYKDRALFGIIFQVKDNNWVHAYTNIFKASGKKSPFVLRPLYLALPKISGEGQNLKIMAAFPISLSVKSRQTTQPEAYVLVVQFGI